MPDITLRVGCAQLQARPLHEARAALQDILSAIRQARRQRADLVVLPECAYPGYVLLDHNPYRGNIPGAEQALEKICAAAAQASIHVAVGIARPTRRGLENQAVLIDDRGRQVGVYAKSYLWSFDTRWFTRGRAQRVLQTRFGTIGMMICADGRMPEIARRIAAQDAWLILDPTAWVSYGSSFESMVNPQAEYMLRMRALENATWIAAADKCGSELSAVYYVGRSQIVAPDGSVVAMASTTRPELIVSELRRARRRVAFSLPRTRAKLLTSRVQGRGPAGVVWLGVYQAPLRRAQDEKTTLQTLQAQSVDVLIRTDAQPHALRSALASCKQLRAACIEGRAMLVPECARAVARTGIDLLLWLQPPRNLPVLELARTRALESRIYVLLCARPRVDVSACLIDPNGNVVAEALRNVAGAFMAPLELSAARRKLVVPGTQVFEPSLPPVKV